MRVELGERLRAVASLVPRGLRAADIGTDHAYLAAYLVQEEICPLVVAADRNPGPLAAAAQLVAELALPERIAVRLGDGLSVLTPGEADVVIIAGMGGHTIMEILLAGAVQLAEVRRLVLQPQRDQAALRRFLAHSGWRIVAERAARERGLYYEVLAAERGEMTLTEGEARFGPCLLAAREPLLAEHLQEQLAKCGRLLAQLTPEQEQRRRQLMRDEALYRELLAAF